LLGRQENLHFFLYSLLHHFHFHISFISSHLLLPSITSHHAPKYPLSNHLHCTAPNASPCFPPCYHPLVQVPPSSATMHHTTRQSEFFSCSCLSRTCRSPLHPRTATLGRVQSCMKNVGETFLPCRSALQDESCYAVRTYIAVLVFLQRVARIIEDVEGCSGCAEACRGGASVVR
jgi:hypothetical protein